MPIASHKPVLVAAAFPAPGHTTPVIQLAEHLIKRGHPFYFVGGAAFKAPIERAGATFVENPWRWEPVAASRPPDAPEVWNLKHLFQDSVPVAHSALKGTLERARREHPARQVIILHESLSCGLGPFTHGAPLPEGYTALPKVINFHSSIYITKDDNRPPFGPGFPYDPTPENLTLWRRTYEAMAPAFEGLVEHINNFYKACGATRPVKDFFDLVMYAGDVTVLATSQSLEYPIRHRLSQLRFIGGLPLQPPSASTVYPAWWSTITANAALPGDSPDKKKVVFVTQGTVHRDYKEIILPTLRALAGRKDLIVVATLGQREAELPADTIVPDNAIVIDYFSYNAILPYTDVFVSNAGYGGFMQGVMNGVPMVLAGTVADKAEVCARAEWAGVAVNLRCQAPDEAALGAAVDKVLKHDSYKARALELKRENEELDALSKIEAIVDEMTEEQQ